VHVAGKGQPCLFVHGGPGSTSYYFEAMPSAALVEKKLSMAYFRTLIDKHKGKVIVILTGDGHYPYLHDYLCTLNIVLLHP
jgi:hypothetical protein